MALRLDERVATLLGGDLLVSCNKGDWKSEVKRADRLERRKGRTDPWVRVGSFRPHSALHPSRSSHDYLVASSLEEFASSDGDAVRVAFGALRRCRISDMVVVGRSMPVRSTPA